MSSFNTQMIKAAKRNIQPHVLKTPLLHSQSLSRLCGCRVYLKMECWQTCGCFKEGSNNTAIIGAEPEASPGAYLSMRKGEPCERIDLQPSVADGLAGGFSPLPFEIAHTLLEQVALAGEDEIIAAMKAFFTEEQLVIEGAASVGLAVLLSGKIRRPDQKVVLVVTGRNIDSDRFLSIISQREG